MKTRHRASRWLGSGLLAGLLMLCAVPARAEAPSAQARSAARALATQGDKLWDQNDYPGALDKFTRAFELVGAPSLGVRQAECLEKLGRLVEASERYQQILRMPLDESAPAAFRQAVETARQRADQLRPRLPMLSVAVKGDHLAGAKLTLDGKEVPEAMWGAEWPADPGTHQLELVKGDRRASLQVTLEEGKPQKVELVLPPGTEAEAEPAPPAPPPPAATTTAPAPPPAVPPGAPAKPPPKPPAPVVSSSQPTWGWITLSVGVVGLAAGGVTVAMLTSQRSKLDEECTGTRCPSAQSSDVDRYNQLRPFPTIGFAVGGAAFATGIILLLTAPSSPEQPGTQAYIGPGSAGLRGSF
jgi:hypothetical protein